MYRGVEILCGGAIPAGFKQCGGSTEEEAIDTPGQGRKLLQSEAQRRGDLEAGAAWPKAWRGTVRGGCGVLRSTHPSDSGR